MDDLDRDKLRNAYFASHWPDPAFTEAKAYVMLYFASLAYETLPGMQVDQHRRVNLFLPVGSAGLEAYERFLGDYLKGMFIADITGGEGGGEIPEGGQVFVILRNEVHIVGLVRPNLIVIALRGTKVLWDFLVDANALHEGYYIGYRRYRFHSGFYHSIAPWFDTISQKIRLLLPSFSAPPTIYVTGHSLGGAMAGITNLLDPLRVDVKGADTKASITACYTFGMPRYGDEAVMSADRWPHHIYHDKDIISGVPPVWVGYGANGPERLLDDTRLHPPAIRPRISKRAWLKDLVTVNFKEHMPPLYRRRLGQLV